jgi:hypothetical protein
MDLEQLLAALAKLQNGVALAEAVKALLAAEDAKTTEALTKQQAAVKESKSVKTQVETLTKQLSLVREKLGADEDSDLAEAIDGLSKTKGKADGETSALQKRLDKLEKERQAEKASYEERLKESITKQQTTMKRESLLKALTEHKAARPADLIELLLSKVEVGDDDSLTFEGGKKVADGVKTWLGERPEFVKNTQTPGAGSKAPDGTILTSQTDTKGNPLSLGAALAAPVAASGKAALTGQAHFFGENG